MINKVLLVSSEVVPFAKTGGLADVAGALPKALKKEGIDVRVVLPKHNCKNCKCNGTYLTHFPVEFAGKKETVVVLQTAIEDVPVYILDNAQYFGRPELYGEKGKDYEDNALRFAFFSKAVIELTKHIDFIPDVFHVNDWQTSLIPVYLKTIYTDINSGVVLTIHNIQYQGIFDMSFFKDLGLPSDVLHWEKMEYFGKLNYLKAGIVYADFVNTVSPTYAKEIQTSEFGYGLENVLNFYKDKVVGILNGIDVDYWNPERDPMIWHNYKELENKKKNRDKLIEMTKIEGSNIVFGMVSRLADQKGLDILIPAVERVVENENASFVFLGSGNPEFEEALSALAKKYPNKVWVEIGYNEELAHKIYAGTDAFLIPSKFEPCGLTQMISMRYGTVPVVRHTGGLADTVDDVKEVGNEKATGVKFYGYNIDELEEAIRRAIELYSTSIWTTLAKNGMNKDFSWNSSAKEYINLYTKAKK